MTEHRKLLAFYINLSRPHELFFLKRTRPYNYDFDIALLYLTSLVPFSNVHIFKIYASFILLLLVMLLMSFDLALAYFCTNVMLSCALLSYVLYYTQDLISNLLRSNQWPRSIVLARHILSYQNL